MDYSLLRRIPKMDRLLENTDLMQAAGTLPRAKVRAVLQEGLDTLRAALLAGEPMPEEDALYEGLRERLRDADTYRLRNLVNATGIVLHTNLGRAPLGEEIARHVAQVVAGYSNLEYDLAAGQRGSRYSIIEELLCELTGAEAAMVVNNNAAAVFLMLNTMASGKKVAISRGELVEIGGSFRIPEIMKASGASLLEIGTTNKTKRADYETALDEGAEVLLKVHTSNFVVTGFTQSCETDELQDLAAERKVPVLYDLGSGFLLRPEELGLHDGVYVPDAVAQCEVVCFSGDKLLGGGQAGIVLGRREAVEAMKKNQLARMLRVDKMTLAALEAVLRWYSDPKQAKAKIPVLAMLGADREDLQSRARLLAERLSSCCSLCRFEAVECLDEPGGGSLPSVTMPGWAVAVPGVSPNRLEEALRGWKKPIIARIHKDTLMLSVRTLLEGDEETILEFFTEMRCLP